MSAEREAWLAIREGHLNAADAEYFGARPQIDTADRHRVFYAGFCKGYDAGQSQPPAERAALSDEEISRIRHVANEWADMATNGLQWLRNIADGISTVDDALANMTTNLAHCHEVRDAAILTTQGTKSHD